MFLPTEQRQDGHQRHAFRALLWVNQRCKARTVPIPSYDIVAAEIDTVQGVVLLVAAYEAGDGEDTATNEQEVAHWLQLIEEAFRGRQIAHPDRTVYLLVAADLNRHHILWSGTHTQNHCRRNEGQEIVDFITQHSLQSLLPPGTTWEHQSGKHATTPDIVLASSELADTYDLCRIYPSDHGSDHRAIECAFHLQPTSYTARQGQRMYDKAEWPEIRKHVQQALSTPGNRDMEPLPIHTSEQLEQEALRLDTIIHQALEQGVPRARPSPYAKRWWTPTLTQLREHMTQLRNRVTSLRRRGVDFSEAQRRFRDSKRIYHDAIDESKATHWKEFLNDPANIWKANSYTKGGTTAFRVATLKDGNTEVPEDEDKATLLMRTFYPRPPEPQDAEPQQPETSIPVPFEITVEEVCDAIWKNNPAKAPGPDQVTFRVWRELWTVVKHQVLQLYRASLRLGQLPDHWKTARIIALRKPHKPDYTKPKAYRPISLLPTLSKGLETVVA